VFTALPFGSEKSDDDALVAVIATMLGGAKAKTHSKVPLAECVCQVIQASR